MYGGYPAPYGAPPPGTPYNGQPSPYGAYPGFYPAAAPPGGYAQPPAPYPQAAPGAQPPAPAPSSVPAASSGTTTSAYPNVGGSSLMFPTAAAAPGADNRQPTAQPPYPYGAPPPAQPPGSYAQAAAVGTYVPYPYNGAAAPGAAPPAQQAMAPGVFGQPSAYSAPPAYSQPSTSAPAPQTAYMPPTTYAPAPGHGMRRRRALLIGCSYAGTTAALNGCLNDVQCIQYLLKNRFGFTDQQIVVLRDDTRDPNYVSNKNNIYKGIQWLTMDQQPGDSLFFHFSGHGSQKYDGNGDEEDGYDETILPTDFQRAGQIVDDELNRILVRPLRSGVTLHAVVDACHSGTVLDLPFRAKMDGSKRWYWKGRARADKSTCGGTAFQFGACKDHQVAQDTNKLSGKVHTGAATFCFIEAIEKQGIQQTYAQLLSTMSVSLEAATGTPGMKLGSTGSMIAGLLLGNAASAIVAGGQTPVLTCDKPVDLYNARLSL